MRKAIGLTLLALTLVGQPVAARFLPAIAGDKAAPECRTALAMAHKAFLSTSASLTWPIARPDGAAAKIALSRDAEDISGGDGLQADPTIFDRTEYGIGPSGRVYWQREARGTRIVVVDENASWRGDWYYLYSLNDSVTEKEFLGKIAQNDGSTEPFAPLLGDGNWTPPVILQDSHSRKLWAIDPGPPYLAMGDWRVLTVKARGMGSPCRIDFTPAGEAGVNQLPAAVRRFAKLADEALGPGINEGTLRPTERIRSDVARDWAIVGNRPWALTDNPYNNREEVDAGLRDWARGVPRRARVYRAMLDGYHGAAAALANYFKRQFGVREKVARAYSAYAMDHMLRSYFVFHSDRPFEVHLDERERGSATPWPSGVR